jgi:hypothetical protein
MSKINETKLAFENGVADGVSNTNVLEALAGCEDIMPASLCRDLDVPEGSTFRQGVRSIRDAAEDVRRLRQQDKALGMD